MNGGDAEDGERCRGVGQARPCSVIHKTEHRDYEHCFAGVERGSVVAISTHGLWRVGKLRHGFIRGLYEMVDRLAPPVVILHGTDHRHIRQALGSDVEVVRYLPERSRVRKSA